MTEWPAADHLRRPGTDQSEHPTQGKLQIVGIGPGLPDHLTRAAEQAIRTADVVYAAPLYQELLADGDVFSQSDSAGPTLIESKRNELPTQAQETFERVQDGETVVHVSGGDPAVYGKSDLLVILAERTETGRVPIEIVPGVTAALGAAAVLGAPFSDDFCTISLATKRRDPATIEDRLEGAAEAGFVIALYNGWRSLPAALETIERHRSGSVPVALLEDVGRGDVGYSETGETVSIETLGDAEELDPETPGSIVIVGTERTRVLEPANGGRPFLVTPRGDETPFETKQ